MKYKNLGRSGLKVSEISFGSWITFGNALSSASVKSCMQRAFDLGVNFFDNAEVYAKGEAEVLMGEAVRSFRREDLVISTKIYWGGNGPNDTGLSWKHLVEGTRNSLRRMKLSYVDLLFCHRPDPSTPIEETVRAMDYIIKSGYAFYWGTSEWSAEQIEAAYVTAEKYNCIPPTMEQPQYNMFTRDRVEKEYLPIVKKYGTGLTTWSPLASGILSGKYNNGIPRGSRLDKNEWLRQELTPSNIARVKKLAEIANSLDCALAQLAIAWCLRNPNISTVITGASSIEQIEENMKATVVKDRITESVSKEIEKILQ
jgi:voltage-dependent potassium channel beta subunit